MTFDDLITPLTVDEAKASLYSVLAQLGVPTTGWFVGGVVRTIVAMTAIVLVACSMIIVGVAKGGFRQTATGAWLTYQAKDTYGIDRITATFATGTVTLTNVAGGVYNPSAGDTIIQVTATKKTYRNLATYSLGSGTSLSPTSVVVPVEAIEVGTASNVIPNQPMTLVTTMNGVSVTANTAILGTDDEDDSDLSLREDESLDALCFDGPTGAYLALAKTALRADGSNVGVTRALVSPPSSVGELTITVASASGGISGTVGSAGTDLDYVNQYIQGVVPPGCVPAGVTATVVSATTQPIAITADLYVYRTDNRIEADIEAAAETIITAWLAGRPISGDNGATIYQSAILATLMSVSTFCFKGTVTLPAGDVSITSGAVATAGALTITAHLVTP